MAEAYNVVMPSGSKEEEKRGGVVFDFGGIAFPAGEGDQIFLALVDEEAVVSVKVADIASLEPALGKIVLGGGFGTLPVAFGNSGSAEGDLSSLAADFFGRGASLATILTSEKDGGAIIGRAIAHGDGIGTEGNTFCEIPVGQSGVEVGKRNE